MPRKGKGSRKPAVDKLRDHLVTVHSQRAYAAMSMKRMVVNDHRYLHSAENNDLRHHQHSERKLRPPKEQWVANQPPSNDIRRRQGMFNALDALLEMEETDSDPFED